MIEHLNGLILFKENDRIVLDVGGVGYGVAMTLRACEVVGTVGSQARLWISTYVREEEITLYGFLTRAERETFDIFLGVSGLGPRIAIAILDKFEIEPLIQIILRGDSRALTSVPGIGQKKAEKLLLDLKGKVKRLSAGVEPRRLAELGASAPIEATLMEFQSQQARDAVAALQSLDLQPAAASRAIAKALEVLGTDAETEALVHEGLRHRHG